MWKYKNANGDASIGYHLLLVEPSPGEAMRIIKLELPERLQSGFGEQTVFDLERDQLTPFVATYTRKEFYHFNNHAGNADPLDAFVRGGDLNDPLARWDPIRIIDSAHADTVVWRSYKIPEPKLSSYFHDSALTRVTREAAIYDSTQNIARHHIDSMENLSREAEERDRFGRIAAASSASVSIDT
ncbi:MAG TPA: hypothetical protein VFD13_01735, partial [Candidatus Kapabacteria bacterium]|nr:hypothetical protein [Candidatus Kapabacteria bacterium]